MSFIRDMHCEAMDYAREQCEELGVPDRCVCPDNSGSCAWCVAYYDHLNDPTVAE